MRFLRRFFCISSLCLFSSACRSISVMLGASLDSLPDTSSLL